ncbi:MAG TPA: PmoA family protein [Puia sp.]|nr:PmoA family protein [Puia sp.]
MQKIILAPVFILCCLFHGVTAEAQFTEPVRLVSANGQKAVEVWIGGRLFTRFIYPDSLEKPVLFPLYTADGTVVTRGFPLAPRPGDPMDHPHHVGYWFNYEDVNGLDFWNNSYAIPSDKKDRYGWIKTDRIEKIEDGNPGVLIYHANWVNQRGGVLLEETTRFEFSGNRHQRMVDRITELKANVDVRFPDIKDGLLGLRVAHELQIPSKEDQEYTDAKGNKTLVKGGTDKIANGNYLTSEGKTGDSAWATRAVWCKMFGRMGKDSVSIVIIDHPKNPGYPTYWHARGYGLFAANPLGQKIFSQGKEELNLQLKKGETVRFRYRLLIEENKRTITPGEINRLAAQFAGNRD